MSAKLDHYLELLWHKPGALKRSLALRQEREHGAWPDCFDELWRQIEAKVGPTEGARQIVDVAMLCREHGPTRVELAVRGALAAGCHDGRAVALLARRQPERRPAAQLELGERLARIKRPEPDLAAMASCSAGRRGDEGAALRGACPGRARPERDAR